MWLTKTNLKSPWKVYTYMCLSDLCVFFMNIRMIFSVRFVA